MINMRDAITFRLPKIRPNFWVDIFTLYGQELMSPVRTAIVWEDPPQPPFVRAGPFHFPQKMAEGAEGAEGEGGEREIFGNQKVFLTGKIPHSSHPSTVFLAIARQF